VEGNGVKILWEFDIRTDNIISARRPDIVVCGLQSENWNYYRCSYSSRYQEFLKKKRRS